MFLQRDSIYHIGSGAAQRILDRFKDSGFTLKVMEPHQVEEVIYPPANLKRKDTPMPDFQYYYDRIHAKGSRVNIAYCWLEYKQEHSDGYEQSQFYEYYNRFVEQNFGKADSKMAVEQVPGEKMYIDWVGDQPELLTDPETGEVKYTLGPGPGNIDFSGENKEKEYRKLLRTIFELPEQRKPEIGKRPEWLTDEMPDESH